MAQTTALPLETNTHTTAVTPPTLFMCCAFTDNAFFCNAEIMTTFQIYMIKCVTHLLHVEMHVYNKKQAVIKEDAGKRVLGLIKLPIKVHNHIEKLENGYEKLHWVKKHFKW